MKEDPVLAAEDEDEQSSDLVRVFRCRFDKEWDVNFDAWPDRWTRRYDDLHPQYVKMQILSIEDEKIPGRMLQILPDGASAIATSPPIHVMPKFSYKLRLLMRVTGATHGTARVRMAFHNRRDELRQIQQTDAIVTQGGWAEVELGDFQPNDDEIDRVYLHLEYDRGRRGDLAARVEVADVRLYRLPSIKISTGSRYNVYTDPNDVTVTCSLSGILEQNPEVRFELLDATNQSIGDGGRLSLNGKIIDQKRALASQIVDGYGSDKTSYEGAIDWKPQIGGYGFYRIRVGMYRAGTNIPLGDARSITVAVVREELESSERSEFGWTLPQADRPLPFSVLQELLPRVGVSLLKVPVWYQAGDEQRGDELLRFAEQLAARKIETIGVLEDPSLWIDDPLSQAKAPPIEGLLSADASYWTPLIDHIITRLSLRIRWWQLGHDGDTSFVGYRRLVESIGAIRNQMFRFGQDIRLGIGWRWDHPTEWKRAPTWDFEQMAGREQLDAAGLESALSKAAPTTTQRWVLVAPPEVPLDLPEGVVPGSPEGHAALVNRHQRRVRDFVEQVLVAKMSGADGIFIADPFSGSVDATENRTGVMNHDGTAGELLLPWRTCARLLGGARYLGEINLPNKSNNWLFKRPDGEVVMVLWNLEAETDDANATPIDEVLYLGENVQVIDIWGASVKPAMHGSRHVVPVGRMPRFVLGLNEPIARWRMRTRFEVDSAPSIFGVPHENALLFENTFPQGVGGTFRVVVPPRGIENAALSDVTTPEWSVDLFQERMSLSAGQESRSGLEVTLRKASYGEHAVRVDFEISADQDYRFSVWRNLRVGMDDLTLDAVTFLGEDGRLIVEQRMSKSTGPPADFNCLLYANDRRRKRTQVFQLGPEIDKKRYTYLNSEGLIGSEMRLQVEEQDGGRVLIHRFTADPRPLSESDKPESGEFAESAR